MKPRALLAGVALCATLSAPPFALAQREVADENGLLAAISREFARSSQLLEQFWDSAFGAPQEQEDGVVVIVIEEQDANAPLTLEEKTLACRVAVERVDEQRVLAREAQRMNARLRTPMGRLVSFHFEDETSCNDLATPRHVGECERVLGMDKEIAAFLEEGRTTEEICDAVQMMDEMVESTQDPPPLSCKLCKRFVAMVTKAIAQDLAHVQEVREILGDICDSMSVDSMCHTFLKQYDDVVNWLIAGTSPDVVCQRLMMCSANEFALVKTDDDDEDHACYYCEHIVGVVVFVEQHAPRHLPQVRKLLHYVCKLSPSDCKCDETVQQFDKIVDLTKQGKSPVEVCQAIGMCKKQGGRQSKLTALLTNPVVAEKVSALILNELPQQIGDDKTCFYCEYFTTLLEVAIQENPQGIDQVRQYADLICGILGENKYCKQYVTKLGTVIDAIKSGKQPREICTNLQYCVKKVEEDTLNLPALRDDKYCFYCEYFVTLLDIVICEDQADIDQIRQYADMICGMLGDDNVCHQYVDKFDNAIDMLKQGKKPREVCTQFKFCTKSQQLALPPPPALVNDDKTCFYCDYLVTLLEIVIQQDKADVGQVRQFADMICGMLGDDNVCHQYVGKLDAAIDGLKQGKKPREICAELKYCAKAIEVAKLPAVRDNNSCLYCDYFVTILEVVILNDESDIDLFREYADMICGMLGDGNICHQYVSKIDTIVDGLKQGKKSHDICIEAKYCTKSQHQLTLPSPVATNDAKTCAYCDYFAAILQVVLQEDPNDVDAVRLYAGIICGMLGDDNVCHQYLSKFEYAIDALNKGKKPRDICTEFKYCGAKFEIADTSSLLKGAMVKSVVDPIDECFFCTQVANLIKVAVAQDPSQVSQIRTVADLICKTLPAANKCHKVMKEMDQIIDSIKKGEEPGAICQEMKFCKKASKSLPLTTSVKNNKCAYCDGIATVLQYAIKSRPGQVQQVREIAGIVCDLMPQDDTCHKDLRMFDSAVAAFKSGKSPHDVCLSFGFCSTSGSTSSKFTPLSLEKLNRLDAKAVEADKSMSMGCLLCEYTAESLVFIKGSQSELRLAKQALETMCVVLPPSARCDVLSSNFDNLVELVSQGKSPSQACHTLSMCDAAFVEDPKVELKRLSAVMAEQRS